MNRKAKIIGATLAVMVATSALAASASAAVTHDFTTSAELATVDAQALAKFSFENTTSGGPLNVCSEATLETTVGETQGELTMTPSFGECEFFSEGSGSMGFIVNGCHFRFTGETTSGNPTGGEHANLHIDCPPEKKIETRVTAFQFKCSSIPEQTIPDAVRYENETTEDKTTHFKIETTAHGVESTTEESIAGCGEEVHTNGSITGEVTVTAFEDEAKEKPASISVGGTE